MTERGNAALELVLGVCLLLLPVTMLVVTLPEWLERQAAVRLAAAEAARALALSSAWAEGTADAEAAVARIGRGHGLQPGDLQVTLAGDLRRGAYVQAEVRTVVPLTRIPGFGALGGFTVVARHAERVDPYRSW